MKVKVKFKISSVHFLMCFLIFELLLANVYAVMEQHQNKSYLGMVVFYAVSAVVLSNSIFRIMEFEHKRKIRRLEAEIYHYKAMEAEIDNMTDAEIEKRSIEILRRINDD